MNQSKSKMEVLVSYFVILFLLAAPTILASPDPNEESHFYLDRYPSKLDHLDVDGILNSDRMLSSYIKCLLDKGSCTHEGQEIKKVLPEVIKNNCAKCNDSQKVMLKKALQHVKEQRPEEWYLLQDKYDLQGDKLHQIEHALGL